MTLRPIAAAVLATVLLAGCSREPPPPPPADETPVQESEDVAEPAPKAPPPVVVAPPAPPPAPEANFEEPAEEPIDPSDQTLEDADATGLTTRATRSDDAQSDPAGSGSRDGNEE